jgi:hypothetical protein
MFDARSKRWPFPCTAVVALSLSIASSAAAAADPAREACSAQPLTSAAELVACIQQPALTGHLVAFQQISDQNPGPDGHGNRNTGTPGYQASVAYVAALMRQAGYRVTLQSYNYTDFRVTGVPSFSVGDRSYVLDNEWQVARLSGAGSLAANLQPLAGGVGGAAADARRRGCALSDFAGFVSGRVAVIEQGGCDADTKVKNAEDARASGVVLVELAAAAAAARDADRAGAGSGRAHRVSLRRPAGVPVVSLVSPTEGAGLLGRLAGRTDGAPIVRLDIRAQSTPNAIDYNLIADSPFGDPDHVVVLEAHLDAIHGAGILDNASGSATLLEIGVQMAKTPTRHQLRYIWFGGEEIDLLGSAFYTKSLTADERARIVFDIDADVTATPNYAVLIADPAHAPNADLFPANVIPESRRGNRYFTEYFAEAGIPSRLASFGNEGTDSNSFSLVGIPNTGVLTGQDCCKGPVQVLLWGGVVGNYEGRVPGLDGGCVDRVHRWCDNLDNTSPQVHEFISRSVAWVTWQIANDPGLDRATRQAGER